MHARSTVFMEVFSTYVKRGDIYMQIYAYNQAIYFWQCAFESCP